MGRRYWPGKFHPGDIIFHLDKTCRVAGDSELGGLNSEVPAGHIPVYWCDVMGYCRGSVYTVPLDDVIAPIRKGAD